jgi:pimeloyl-ACP methyl ester carboxylesterase
MTDFAARDLTTPRHRTAYLEAGPADGPPMIFIHGWPELGIVWRAQLDHFARAGWRCIAPDMRGYGGSSIPAEAFAYSVRDIVADMVELHDALGGAPAIWVGHDWGSPIVWALAAHHPERCRGVVNLCVPYFAHGFGLGEAAKLIDRTIYPVDVHPAGQWDYFLWYAENAAQAAADFEADVPATIALLYRSGHPGLLGQPALTAGVRARGGWFGPARRAPQMPRDPAILDDEDYATLVAAFTANGFTGPDSWYLNGAANDAYAREAPNDGRLTLPVLFLHAAWDTVCDTVHGRLAEPMRESCDDLAEATFDAGHWLAQEKPAEVNAAISTWLAVKRFGP